MLGQIFSKNGVSTYHYVGAWLGFTNPLGRKINHEDQEDEHLGATHQAV